MARIAIYTQGIIDYCDTDNITRIEVSLDYSVVYCTDREELVVAKPLTFFEQKMGKYGFTRAHNRHLVNPMHVKRFLKQDGGKLIMTDDKEIPVSRRKKKVCISRLNKMVDEII